MSAKYIVDFKTLYVYYEPIKDNIYVTYWDQGKEVKELRWAEGADKRFALTWYFRPKWKGSARFHYVGTL